MAKAAFNPKHRAHRIFWVLNSGAHWRDMPERYGQWETIYGRYRRWVREGLFDRMFFRREPRRRYGGASQSRLSVGWIPA